MSTGDAARYSLYSRLEELLGTSDADYLMTHLPSQLSDEVASKGGIAHLESRFDRLENRIEARFDRMEDRMDQMQRFYVGTTVGSMTALTAIFSLVVAFFG